MRLRPSIEAADLPQILGARQPLPKTARYRAASRDSHGDSLERCARICANRTKVLGPNWPRTPSLYTELTHGMRKMGAEPAFECVRPLVPGCTTDVLHAHGEPPLGVRVTQAAGALVHRDRWIEIFEDLGGPLTVGHRGVIAVDAERVGDVVRIHTHTAPDHPVDVQADGVVGAADRVVGRIRRIDVSGALAPVLYDCDDLEVGRRASARCLGSLRLGGRATEFQAVPHCEFAEVGAAFPRRTPGHRTDEARRDGG